MEGNKVYNSCPLDFCHMIEPGDCQELLILSISDGTVWRPRRGTRLTVAPLGARSMQQKLEKSRLLLPLYLTPVGQWCIRTQLVRDQRAPQSVLAVLSAHWRLQSTRANHRRQSGCRMRIKGHCSFFMLQTGMLISLLASSPNILIVTPELSTEG